MTPRLLGASDDVTTCDCCGKSNLKRTVTLDFDGDVRHYGVDCAAKALHPRPKAADVKYLRKQADALSLAARWLEKGHPAKVVAMGIWNRFGFLTDVKGGKILIDGCGSVDIPEAA